MNLLARILNARVFLCVGTLILTIIVSSCAKKFDPLMAKAGRSFAEADYVNTIDTLSLALRNWRESDGTEKKAQASQLLGKAYKEIGKHDKAMEHFSNAIELSTNTYESAYTLGLLYLMASQPKNAIRAFKESLKMNKDDCRALVGLGNGYFAIGDLAQARVAYQRVLDTAPGVAESIESLSIIDRRLQAGKKSGSPRRK